MYPVTGRPTVDLFLKREIDHCKRNNIEVNFINEEYCNDGIVQTTGWFDESTLAVAIKKPLNKWLSVFVHESCHKDQYLQEDPTWNTKINGFDACTILDHWLAHVCELDRKQFIEVINKVRAVELNCEKRAVRKIVANDLPISLARYKQEANAYIWSYTALMHTRKWIPDVTKSEKLVQTMPIYFQPDYSKLPPNFLELANA